MSPQADYIVANGTGAAVRSDINGQLAAIVSNNSGATQPATMYAYQWWADTTTGLLKLRNSANSAWITLFQLDGEWTTLPIENGTAAAPSIYFKDSGTDTGIYSPGADQVAITTGGTVRTTVDSSGRLLVGTSTAFSDERLNVVRTDATGLVLNLYSSASTSTTKIANSLLRVSSNASNADTSINFTDNTSNNYYFGGNNGGAYVMSNSAGVRLSNGGTSWASDSDERLKDIIEPIENGLDKVATLRTVIGKYKTDDEDRRRSFLIAQDVQAVLPEAVFDEQGTLMLAYTETIPLLVAALKESKERIESLEAKVAALEAV